MTRVAMITVIALVSCQRSSTIPNTCLEADKLRWVEHANFQEDFASTSSESTTCVSISVFRLSFSTAFPGLQDTSEMQRLVQEHGSRRIEGTTDVISCIEQRQLLRRVFHYAVQYNNMILGYREPPNRGIKRWSLVLFRCHE